jgi:hypothetical protein
VVSSGSSCSFSHSFVLAAILTYIIYGVLVLIRQHYGLKNIAAKTLVDSRFLL